MSSVQVVHDLELHKHIFQFVVGVLELRKGKDDEFSYPSCCGGINIAC